MTFDECHRVIKKGDTVALRSALERATVSANLSNQYGWTLLMLAALEGERTIGELLLDQGASVNATNDFGETPLSLAAHKGHLQFVRLLLDRGAAPTPRPHGTDLDRWLQSASGLPDERIASILELIRKRRESASK